VREIRSLFVRGSTVDEIFDQVWRVRDKEEQAGALRRALGKVRDPRIDRTKLHPLLNVLVMALCGALAGANGWDELAAFARARRKWFALLLEMPNGTPSADTFRRVFEALDPRELEGALQAWVSAVGQSFVGEVIAIDGKALKAAIEHAGSTTPLHLLHVWATKQHLLLGQRLVDGAPGETSGIVDVLARLRIEGAVVTTDANGCTKSVTASVRNAKADYVLALKGNRGPLHEHVQQLFATAEARRFRGVSTHKSKDKGHGRNEERVVRVLPLPDAPVLDGWCDAKTAVLIDRTRRMAGETTKERHYYISSLPPEPARLAEAIRAHWGIENHLHWTLDVAFDEDSRTMRDEHSAQNWALVTRLALMILKRSPDKLSINLKRKRAAWEPDYVAELLARGI
jgi:predicted transposase YbfD/YdcC